LQGVSSFLDQGYRHIGERVERHQVYGFWITRGQRMASKTKWSERRLRHLFERYNQIYWRGKLSGYRPAIGALPSNIVGVCNAPKHAIAIDIAKHATDYGIRGTLLHEMAHAAAHIRGSRGHDVKFFGELERPLRLKALDWGLIQNASI
jgi:SprT-like family